MNRLPYRPEEILIEITSYRGNFIQEKISHITVYQISPDLMCKYFLFWMNRAGSLGHEINHLAYFDEPITRHNHIKYKISFKSISGFGSLDKHDKEVKDLIFSSNLNHSSLYDYFVDLIDENSI